MQLNPEAQENLAILRKFFEVPDDCRDPKAYLKKRRALAHKLYNATVGQDSMITVDSPPPSRFDLKSQN